MRREQVLLQIISPAILWPWGVILVISFREVSLVTVQFGRLQMRWTKSRTKVVLMKYQQKQKACVFFLYWIFNLLDTNLSPHPPSKCGNFPQTLYFCAFFCVCVWKAFCFFLLPLDRKGKQEKQQSGTLVLNLLNTLIKQWEGTGLSQSFEPFLTAFLFILLLNVIIQAAFLWTTWIFFNFFFSIVTCLVLICAN